jgi:hypothetical protein
MNGVTELCGLRVGGALAPVGRAASGSPEIVMDAGRVTPPDDDGAIGGLEGHGRPMSLRQVGDATFVRFHGLADAVLDMKAGTATIDVCADAPPGMDQVLAGGPVLAMALALRGQPCLHASAVSMGDRAVAFGGASGAGKSTLAALACLAGADLVADDILALAVNGPELRCLPGSPELRLRPLTAELLADAPWPRRTTADARVAVLAGREDLGTPRLSAVVLPMVTGNEPAGVEQLRGGAAITALLGCARVISLQTPEHHKTMLDLAVSLAASVPVYRVTMPALSRAALPPAISALLNEHLERAP